ncbi:MAG TPA: 16S rRNA (guanine(527)-N(7))-methyltransferase RsmG [Clostridia bacterium]|nr:16S rRNA (guanine(527)-N(7))-methyltransferase RsmG [Clostridia bacterium]
MDKKLLSTGLKSMGIESSEEIEESFEKYMDLLLEWNDKMNLTAITDENEIIAKHFLDSATCLSIDGISEAERLIDVGTGAGFPGIPLRILTNKGKWVLADSLAKRVGFLNRAIDSLGLEDIVAVHSRAEDLGRDKNLRETFDVAVSRAVANLAVLSEYCLPLLSVGGIFLAMKGPKAQEELEDAKLAIEVLGGKVKGRVSVKNSYLESRHEIIVVEKVRNTPKKYPRRPGTPSKNPILQGENK